MLENRFENCFICTQCSKCRFNSTLNKHRLTRSAASQIIVVHRALQCSGQCLVYVCCSCLSVLSPLSFSNLQMRNRDFLGQFEDPLQKGNCVNCVASFRNHNTPIYRFIDIGSHLSVQFLSHVRNTQKKFCSSPWTYI